MKWKYYGKYRPKDIMGVLIRKGLSLFRETEKNLPGKILKSSILSQMVSGKYVSYDQSLCQNKQLWIELLRTYG